MHTSRPWPLHWLLILALALALALLWQHSAEAGGPREVESLIVTAYTAHDAGMRGDGIMANGHHVFQGAAACPPDWPFGVVFYLPELKRWGMCSDRGSAITAGRLDLWMQSRADALEFGRQELAVVLPWGLPPAANGGTSRVTPACGLEAF